MDVELDATAGQLVNGSHFSALDISAALPYGGRARNGVVWALDGLFYPIQSAYNVATCEEISTIEAGKIYEGYSDGVDGSFHRFTATAAGDYCFDTRGSAVDAVMAIYNNCDTRTPHNTAQNSPFLSNLLTDERVTVTLSEGESVDIHIKGATSAAGIPQTGDYRIRIRDDGCRQVTLYDALRRTGRAEFFLTLFGVSIPTSSMT